MTTLLLSMLAGMLVMAGVAVMIWWASPAEPDLADALNLLSPHRPPPTNPGPAAAGAGERAGVWAIRRLPLSWIKVPSRDLAILGRSAASFYGDKLAFTALAAAAVPVLTWLFSLTFTLPLAVPIGATLAGMAAAWFLPDYNVRQDAAKARVEFSRALASYTDLVALERHGGGSGSRQAMEFAADIGDTWAFRRISEELARSRFSGQQPWDALHQLAADLGSRDLDDLADIMRLCGEEGAPVYDTLRAKATATRNAILTADEASANDAGERMFIPSSLTAVVFLAILIVPALLRMLNL
jgi:hypothetical protein